MYRFLLTTIIITALTSCARGISTSHIKASVSEKELQMSKTNQEYSDASIIGKGARLIENKVIAPTDRIPAINGIRIDDTTGRLVMSQSILFDFDSNKVKESAMQSLIEIVNTFNKTQASSIQIYGYTDNIGSKVYNKQLSQRRAESIAQVLINLGIDKAHIEIIAKGDSFPIASNQTEEGRLQNRRVEIKFIP